MTDTDLVFIETCVSVSTVSVHQESAVASNGIRVLVSNPLTLLASQVATAGSCREGNHRWSLVYVFAAKANGEPFTAETVPPRALVDEALAAQQIIVVGDSDLSKNHVGHVRKRGRSIIGSTKRRRTSALSRRRFSHALG